MVTAQLKPKPASCLDSAPSPPSFVSQAGADLSQLSVDVPEGIKVSARIVVADQSDKKIDATVSVNDRRVTIAFSQPVPTETTMSVSMNGVRTSGLNYSRTWLYPVYSRSVGMTADVRVGMARIQTYDD